MGQTDKYKYNM